MLNGTLRNQLSGDIQVSADLQTRDLNKRSMAPSAGAISSNVLAFSVPFPIISCVLYEN
jgi:hypothetical protein